MVSPVRLSRPVAEVAPAVVLLIVEGAADQAIVRGLLEAAGYPVERVQIQIAQGREAAARIVADLPEAGPERRAVLVDLDERSLPEARIHAQEDLGELPVEVFCAIPSTEAWLFADDLAVLAHARPDKVVQGIVRRLPLPEEIPEPKELARRVFGPVSSWDFLREVDIGRAAARSPSLRIFLEGMGRLLEVPSSDVLEATGRHFSRDIIAGLIREVTPADAVLWRTLSGDELTADELRRHIEAGDEVGRQYASDLLRISRDFLRRKANRPQHQ